MNNSVSEKLIYLMYKNINPAPGQIEYFKGEGDAIEKDAQLTQQGEQELAWSILDSSLYY